MANYGGIYRRYYPPQRPRIVPGTVTFVAPPTPSHEYLAALVAKRQAIIDASTRRGTRPHWSLYIKRPVITLFPVAQPPQVTWAWLAAWLLNRQRIIDATTRLRDPRLYWRSRFLRRWIQPTGDTEEEVPDADLWTQVRDDTASTWTQVRDDTTDLWTQVRDDTTTTWEPR